MRRKSPPRQQRGSSQGPDGWRKVAGVDVEDSNSSVSYDRGTIKAACLWLTLGCSGCGGDHMEAEPHGMAAYLTPETPGRDAAGAVLGHHDGHA
jgi:hypothetical protein